MHTVKYILKCLWQHKEIVSLWLTTVGSYMGVAPLVFISIISHLYISVSASSLLSFILGYFPNF